MVKDISTTKKAPDKELNKRPKHLIGQINASNYKSRTFQFPTVRDFLSWHQQIISSSTLIIMAPKSKE